MNSSKIPCGGFYIDPEYLYFAKDENGKPIMSIIHEALVGIQGPKGDKGDPFSITKIYKTIEEMEADHANEEVPIDSFVIIEDVEHTEDNGKLYIKDVDGFDYITDLSTGVMIEGPQGNDGVGVPHGGRAGQALMKASNEDFVTQWVDVLFNFDLYYLYKNSVGTVIDVTNYISVETFNHLLTVLNNNHKPVIMFDGSKAIIMDLTASSVEFQISEIYDFDGNVFADISAFILEVNNNKVMMEVTVKTQKSLTEDPVHPVKFVTIIQNKLYNTGAKQFVLDKNLQQIESLVAAGNIVVLNYDGKSYIYSDNIRQGFHNIYGHTQTLMIGLENTADYFMDECYLFPTISATENSVVFTKIKLT